MFNFVVFFEIFLASVFQGAGLAFLWCCASSCSILSLAQLIPPAGVEGLQIDRRKYKVAVLFLYVYPQAGKSFVAPGEFGFCGLSLGGFSGSCWCLVREFLFSLCFGSACGPVWERRTTPNGTSESWVDG